MVEIDARGLSCPQPVLMTLDEIKKNSEKIVVLVDTEASKENVTRAAANKGYELTDLREDTDSYTLTLVKE